jgi:glycerol uptake facilitator-like aquaporin
MEGVGTFCLTWLSGSLGVSLTNYDITIVGPFASVWFGALLAILIYATATKSGGHLNPLFTLPLMVAGFTPVPRGVLYIIFQIAGAAVGGGFLLASLGYEKARQLVQHWLLTPEHNTN